jgi:opacity protein-like surface antigen
MAQGKSTITPFAGIVINGSTELTVGGIYDHKLSDNLYLEVEAGIVFSETWLMGGAGLLYQFDLKNSPVQPFIVAGATINYVSVDIFGESYDDTSLKINVGGGVKFDISKGVKMRAEFRTFFIDGSYNRIMAGIELPL